MLNQVSVEAVYSATYVENYLDCVENLPDELQRLISRMRELDVYYIGNSVKNIIIVIYFLATKLHYFYKDLICKKIFQRG